MVRSVLRLAIASLLHSALVECSSSYHPEYHPVTVSNVMVNNGGSPSERSPVYVVPGAPPGVAPPPPREPPPGFFEDR